jgi:hypothetical protein
MTIYTAIQIVNNELGSVNTKRSVDLLKIISSFYFSIPVRISF